MESSISKVGTGHQPYPYAYETTDKDPVAFFLSDEGGLVVPNVVLKILTYLNLKSLSSCFLVNKLWCEIASDSHAWGDLSKMSSCLKVIDGSFWQTHVDLVTHGLSVDDEPPVHKSKEVPNLKKGLCLSIEKKAGVTYLTIPKGLTFNKLVKLAGSPKVGNITQFRYISDRILSEFGDIQVDKTYRIVITNNIFTSSRDLSFNDQKALVSKIGCEMPRLLEASVLLVVTFIGSGVCLYSDNPCTYTRCLEQLSGDHLDVGDFSKNGVDIDNFRFNRSSLGVGGVLRKF